jgi:hypothetical protein
MLANNGTVGQFESSPGVRKRSFWLWVGEEELQSATPGGKLLGGLERPEYSIFCIFTLCHLLGLDQVPDALSIVQGAKAERARDMKRRASQKTAMVCRADIGTGSARTEK